MKKENNIKELFGMDIIKKRSLVILILLLLSANSLIAGDRSNIDSGATVWMLTSTALVLLMVPGLAMFYGGLVRTKNVLGTIMHSFIAMGIITHTMGGSWLFNVFRWQRAGGWFGWNSDYFMLRGIDNKVMERGDTRVRVLDVDGKLAIITSGPYSRGICRKSFVQSVHYIHCLVEYTGIQPALSLGLGI
ncbi:MAG: hypothetical protein U0X39_00010 [Bacteroidales bacterium]